MYLLHENWMVPLFLKTSPSHKDALCQVWLKLALLILKRRYLSTPIYFAFSDLIPLCKGCVPWISLCGFEKKMKIRKTDGETMREVFLSFQLRWDLTSSVFSTWYGCLLWFAKLEKLRSTKKILWSRCLNYCDVTT